MAGEHTEGMVDMRLQARNKNGHHYVNIDLEDNAIVQIDGKQIHPPKQVELTPEPPLSETLEVGDVYKAGGLCEPETVIAIDGDCLFARWLDHFSDAPRAIMRKRCELEDRGVTIVSRAPKPRLSETVRPGWVINFPNGKDRTLTVMNIKSGYLDFDPPCGSIRITDLDNPGYEVVSKG